MSSFPSLSASLVLPAALAAATYYLGYSTAGGALMGFVLAAAFTVSFGVSGLMLPAAMVALTGLTTRLGARRQRRHSEVRGASQAFANLGPAAVFSILSTVWPGGMDGCLPMAAAACIASATSDTVASEMGRLAGGRTVLVLTLKPCRPGTDGGVSLAGSAAGILSALLVAVAFFVTALTSRALPTPSLLQLCCVWGGGVAGNIADSFLGCTLEKTGIINNDGTNLLSSAFAGLIACAFVIISL